MRLVPVHSNAIRRMQRSDYVRTANRTDVTWTDVKIQRSMRFSEESRIP